MSESTGTRTSRMTRVTDQYRKMATAATGLRPDERARLARLMMQSLDPAELRSAHLEASEQWPELISDAVGYNVRLQDTLAEARDLTLGMQGIAVG